MGEIEVILGSNEGLNGKIAELGDMPRSWKERAEPCIWTITTRPGPTPCIPLSQRTSFSAFYEKNG